MSILTKVEAKGWKGRTFLTAVTIALILGGTTMLYPFMLMVSGALRSDMDSADMTIVPDYMVKNEDLVRKFLETKYNYDPILLNRFRQENNYSFTDMRVPEKANPAAIADLERFAAETDIPIHWRMLGGTELYRGMSCENHVRLVKSLRAKFGDDLSEYNALMGSPVQSWWLVSFRIPRWGESRTVMPDDPLANAYFELMDNSELQEIAYVNLTGLFLELVVYPACGMTTPEKFSEMAGVSVASYEEYSIPERVPPVSQPFLRDMWQQFVLDDRLNLSFIRSDATDAEFQAFLQSHFGTIDNLKQYWHDVDYAGFSDIKLPADNEWVPESHREAYRAFISSQPIESLRLTGPEFVWREFLKKTYGDVAAAAKAHGIEAADWSAFKIPMDQLELSYVNDNTSKLRRRFAARNFKIVLRQMFVQGRAFYNTIIYVMLALAFSLTLQPLVAYALSRFRPPGTWKIIFIFVATMSFPPMVSQIPQFLIIQKMNLLNTFFALVLPVTINGMLIFLLKGFFDSIPKDLYDAAVIDGASEFRIFWQITMAMSTPILAVVALQTFSGAWMAFMHPLIVCPDEKMHVLAVWLQQFQQQASGTAVFASIIVASVPSLIIFMFAQRTIMRGIAVPSEK